MEACVKLSVLNRILLVLAVISYPNLAYAKVYPNVTQFFADNVYGTLALALGVTNSDKISNAHGFKVFEEGKTISISKQPKYCFVIQHYGGKPINAKHQYKVTLWAVTPDEPDKTLVDPYAKDYHITDRSDSSNMPSYCFKKRQRTEFWLEITSSDGEEFDGNYHFKIE